jgi:hypothetical protein
MASDSKRTVSFTVRLPEQKQDFEEIAKMQGFINLSAMARVAFFQYIRRYKLDKRLTVQREKKGGEIPAIIELLGE